MVNYLDSSALVKLIAAEPESNALRDFVGESRAVSSQIAVVEVTRAARRYGVERRGFALLEELDLVPIESSVLDAAAVADPDTLSSLDALHLASALAHRERIDSFVAYDARLAAAARASGLEVASPS